MQLGAIAAAPGISGEVKVKTFTASPENLSAYGTLTTEAGRQLEVEALRATKPGEAIVRFAGVDDRSAAEQLRGEQLYVARSALPLPDEGEYYHTDLIGLRVEDADGAPIGMVKAVHNFGAGDVVEIEREGGGETEFLPFTDDFVPVVDIEGGRMVAVLPRDADDER